MDLLDKEQYKNIIDLLIKSLEFYSDEINYRPKIEKDPPIIKQSAIDLDEGQMARFTLKLVKNITKQMDQNVSDYDELIKNAEEQKEIDPQKIIEDLKKLKNEGINY